MCTKSFKGFKNTGLLFCLILGQAAQASSLSKDFAESLKPVIAENILCIRDIVEEGSGGPIESIKKGASLAVRLTQLIVSAVDTTKIATTHLDILKSDCVQFREQSNRNPKNLKSLVDESQRTYGTTTDSIRDQIVNFRNDQLREIEAQSITHPETKILAHFVTPEYNCVGLKIAARVGILIGVGASLKEYVCSGNNGNYAFMAAAGTGAGISMLFNLTASAEAGSLRIKKYAMLNTNTFNYADKSESQSLALGFVNVLGISRSLTGSDLNNDPLKSSSPLSVSIETRADEIINSDGSSYGITAGFAIALIAPSMIGDNSKGVFKEFRMPISQQRKTVSTLFLNELLNLQLNNKLN